MSLLTKTFPQDLCCTAVALLELLPHLPDQVTHFESACGGFELDLMMHVPVYRQ